MQTIIIIGGGAAGMMAALTASEQTQNQIILLERQARVGRKLFSTGNGRCNLSNRSASEKQYFGSNTAFVLPALCAFGPTETLAFFRTLGLVTRTEPDGKVYPYSDQAGSVLDVLRFALERDQIQVHTDCAARSASRRRNGFSVETSAGSVTGDRLIVAAGGAASPGLGGTEDGYRLLGGFGHTCSPLFPALVQLKTDNTYPRALKGIKTDAGVTLLSEQTVLAYSKGEILFTEYGISGPAVFEISRSAAVSRTPVVIALDLMPDWDQREVFALLTQRRISAAALPAEQFLTGILNKRLGQMTIKYSGLSFSLPCAALTDAQLEGLTGSIKRFALPVTGTTGFAHAQVTAGGMLTAEFSPETLESRLCPGLYAAGEVLDIDGACGGFNLQWAWSSGRLAGRSAAS